MTKAQEDTLYDALVHLFENNWDRGDDYYTETEQHAGMVVHEFAVLVLAFHEAFGARYPLDLSYLDECRKSIRVFEEE